MNNTRTTMKNTHPAAARRAGMHHAAEFAFRRSRLTETSSEIDLPAALAASMPSAEEDDDLIIASIAEEEMEIIAENTAAEAAEVFSGLAEAYGICSRFVREALLKRILLPAAEWTDVIFFFYSMCAAAGAFIDLTHKPLRHCLSK